MFSKEIIELPMLYLIRREPFFAELILQMDVHVGTQIPTAGVNIKKNKMNLYINPYFWQSMNVLEQAEILKHECYHLLHNHISRAKMLDPVMKKTYEDEGTKPKSIKEQLKGMIGHQRFNVSADCAINQYLPNLPEKMHMFDEKGAPVLDDKGVPVTGQPISLESFSKSVGMKADPHMHMEYYYQLVKNSPNKEKIKLSFGPGGEGGMTVDAHELWDDSDEDLDQLEETIKNAAKNALERAENHSAGNVPSDVLAAIDAMNKPSVEWKAQLRRFAANVNEVVTQSSRKKRNRRYGIIFPGTRTDSKLKLAVAVDTSGSVSDEELAQFWGEIDTIHRSGADITIIEADCSIQNVYEFEKNSKPKFKGRGGTAYAPAITKAQELEVDGLIYFGDMDTTQETIVKPQFPVMWAIVRESKPPVDWGHKVHVKVDGRKRK